SKLPSCSACRRAGRMAIHAVKVEDFHSKLSLSIQGSCRHSRQDPRRGKNEKKAGSDGIEAAYRDGTGYMAVPAGWRRRDVVESLRGEEHIELAGFVLRVLKEELEAGTYRIGMLCTNQVTGEKAFAWSGKEIEIAGRERAD
ncbi:MAG: hypothetical protein K2P41_07715, partial [Lachnospiraceae bacterium]|nr:hypothetical protein [Lachnospiraceae bacterium]